MNFISRILIMLSSMFVTAYTYAHASTKEEITFTREYREYGWQKYDKRGTKLNHPVQILKDVYLVEYRLNATNLTIAKVPNPHLSTRNILFTTALSHAQRQRTQQILRSINLLSVQHQCDSNTIIVDDGFQLNVTLKKSGISKSFVWNGNYISELLGLINVINEVSPDNYKFYESGKQEAFKQSLLQATSNP